MGNNFEDFLSGVLKVGFSSDLVVHHNSGEFSEMAEDVKKMHISGETILFKASRRIGLENVIKLLKEAKK